MGLTFAPFSSKISYNPEEADMGASKRKGDGSIFWNRRFKINRAVPLFPLEDS
jgi:hypothetical protein